MCTVLSRGQYRMNEGYKNYTDQTEMYSYWSRTYTGAVYIGYVDRELIFKLANH